MPFPPALRRNRALRRHPQAPRCTREVSPARASRLSRARARRSETDALPSIRLQESESARLSADAARTVLKVRLARTVDEFSQAPRDAPFFCSSHPAGLALERRYAANCRVQHHCALVHLSHPTLTSSRTGRAPGTVLLPSFPSTSPISRFANAAAWSRGKRCSCMPARAEWARPPFNSRERWGRAFWLPRAVPPSSSVVANWGPRSRSTRRPRRSTARPTRSCSACCAPRPRSATRRRS